MLYREQFGFAFRRIATTLLGTAMLLAMLPQAAQAVSLYTDAADSEFGGPMTAAVTNSPYVGGQWEITLQATNTGAITLPDIQFVPQFVWDVTSGTAQPLIYNTSGGTWGNSGLSDSFALTSVSGSYTINRSFSMSRANVDTPLSAVPSSPTGPAASLSTSDLVPAIDLGSFSPSESKSFTLNYTSNPFTPTFADYFVEPSPAPEPSTIALMAAGAATLLGWKLRRRTL